MNRRKFVQSSLAGLAGNPAFSRAPRDRGAEAENVSAWVGLYLPRQSESHPSLEVQDGRDMVSSFAPAALSRLISRKVPFQILIAGKEVPLELRRSGLQTLAGGIGSLRVTVHCSYLQDPWALRWSTTLQNTGSTSVRHLSIMPLFIELSVESDRDHQRVRHLSGSHHYDATYPPRAFRTDEERFMSQDSCKPVRIEACSGRSAYGHVPVLEFAVGPYGHLSGFFVGFEWSSRWYLEARWERNCFEGEPAPPFIVEGNVGLNEFRLEPGESLTIPRIHMGFFEGAGWSACDNALRRYVQEVLSARLEGQIPIPPVSYDHWFGIYESFTLDYLKQQAERAAKLGCEYFCLDAAWYPIKKSFSDGIGNWFSPDPRKFPHGIQPFSDHVRKLGMGFGIWHLIELAAPGSEVLGRYPELYFDNPNSPRGMRHLKTNLQAGRDLALSILRKWIRDWNLTWMRWECSDPQDYTYAVDPSGKLNLACMNGFYQINDTLRAEFPNLYIEGCEGGSTRMDWGFAVRTHGTWLSDQTRDPEVCRFMQTGASRFWPAHFLNSAIPVIRGQGHLGTTSHQLLSRMVGTMSFNGAIAEWNPAATKIAQKHVQVYKRIRESLASPTVFSLEQPQSDRNWDANLFADRTRRRLLLYVFRMEGPDSADMTLPQVSWVQVLGSSSARIQQTSRGTRVRLDPKSSSLWEASF